MEFIYGGKTYELECGERGVRMRERGDSEWQSQVLLYSNIVHILIAKQKYFDKFGMDGEKKWRIECGRAMMDGRYIEKP